MKPKNAKFLADVPVTVEKLLRKEAVSNRRSRNAQLVRILEERYGLTTAETVNATAQPTEAQAA